MRQARKDRQRSSFGSHIYLRRSEFREATLLNAYAELPILQIPHKLYTNSLAASHGVPAPKIYRVWDTPEQIDVAGLPDHFVVKADGGTNSRAVFPLRRIGPDSFLTPRSTDPISQRDLQSYIGRLATKARPPFFAEEFLEQQGTGALPDDIKVFTAYGEIIWTLVRRVQEPGNDNSVSMRYLDEEASDLGAISGRRTHDPSIPVPHEYATLMASAKHLSKASGLDFCRVDMFSTKRGVFFGEITVAPGGKPDYPQEHDEWAGRVWTRATNRLAIDLNQGRPPGVLFGDHKYEWHYAPSDEIHHPGSWGDQTSGCVDCQRLRTI